FGDGSLLSTVQNPSHAYSSTAQFTATLTLTDANGVKATASVLVAVHLLPTVSASANPTAADAPVTVSLGATPSGGSLPYSYSWDFGDGSALGTTQNPSHVYASAGTYTASVTVTDANGGKVTISAPAVAVTPAPLAATASASPTTGDAPLLTTLTGHATGGTAPFTYAWTLGDGSTSTQAGFSHTYGPGLYTIGLTITDAAGKSAYAAIYLTVHPSLSVTT